MDLVSRMREGRRSPAALKIALSHLRSARPDSTVFVFEGVDDIGVYEVWISRCPTSPPYEPLPGKGKDQLLGLRRMLEADTTGLRRSVFFFLDRDFDGLKGQAAGPDVFMHNTYSAENYLASDEVLESLLNDELRCAGDPEARRVVLEQYSLARNRFHALIKDVNFKLFLARKCGIRLANLEDSLGRLLSVGLSDVELLPSVSSAILISLDREPTDEEVRQYQVEFDALFPVVDYRGKYELQFLIRWVTKLAEDRSSPTPRMFAERCSTGHVSAALTLRSLAGRCRLPEKLCSFVAAAA